MEETQNAESTQTPEQTFKESPPPVSFPSVGQPQKSGGAKTLLIVGILVLVGILGFVIYKSATKQNSTSSSEPTPFDNLTAPSNNQGATIPTPAPIATPSAVSKAKVAIQVQNGTGIAGEAAYLQTQLGNLGYTDVKVGNATSQDLTSTQVTFSSNLDSSVVTEITQKLNSIYQNVTATNSGSATFDVVIVTGLRKGATPKPSAAPTATPTPTPTPTATPSGQ